MCTRLGGLSAHVCICSKYGFGIVTSEGIIDLRLIVMLLVGMSWADVLSVMLARGMMCDTRAKRRPADWRRAAEISAARAERDLVAS